MRIAALLLLIVAASCRPKAVPVAEPIDAGSPPAPTPSPPVVDDVDEIVFSAQGKLAFLGGRRGDAFVVVDTTTGTARTYAGGFKKPSIVGFDNRCDVTERGYFAETDPSDGVFVRTQDGARYREDFARGTSLALKGDGAPYATITTSGKQFVRHGTDAFAALPAAGDIFDSDDKNRRTAMIGLDAKGEEIVLDELGGKHWAFHFGPGLLAPKLHWISFERQLLVTVREIDRAKHAICAHDLDGSGPPKCLEFSRPDLFFHYLVSDDGKRIAFGESDGSGDVCWMHVLDRASGKDSKWKVTCGITGELPLRFEGDLLVTDAAPIHNCRQTLIRKYDIATGAVRANDKTALPEDEKLSTWPALYKLDLVTWSEGEYVLARRAGDLLLCKKRDGSCGAPLAKLDEETSTGGASKDGSVLGAIAGHRFIAVDAKSGVKKVDVVVLGRRQ